MLVQRIEEGPVSYGATPVFDVCAVLPRIDLATAGFTEDTVGYREAAYLPSSVAPDKATLKKVSEFSALTECGCWIRTEEADDAYVVLESPNGRSTHFGRSWRRKERHEAPRPG